MRKEEKVVVQPLVFRGLMWGGREKFKGPKEAPELTEEYRSALPEAEVREAIVVDSADEAQEKRERLLEADLLLVSRPELLSVTWAVKVLEQLPLPLVLHGQEHCPGAVLCDLYGYLRSAGRGDAFLALTKRDISRLVRAVRAKKRLSSSTILVIGDGFPSWSQVANPSSPEAVTERLGTKVKVVEMGEFLDLLSKVDRSEGEKLAEEWERKAVKVTPEARRSLPEAALVHLAIERLVEEHGADGVTIDCRFLDEWSMERHKTFYSPCMSLTVLRERGIHAACEADVCALLSMMLLGYIADKPTFMGNIGPVSPEGEWVEIMHCAATVNMDGYDSPPSPLELTDYHRRGTGVATFSPMREGQMVTFARLDKELRSLGAASGTIVEVPLDRICVNWIRVKTKGVRDFMERCLTGDHHAVVYGDVVEELKMFCQLSGMELLSPRG